MKFRQSVMAACLVGALLGLGACNNNKADSNAAMAVKADNTTCPIGGGPVASGVTSSHNGKTVGFCCAGCKGKFDGMTAADKDAKVAAMK